MNSEKLSDAIGEVGGRYYEEAATYRRRKHGWVKWAGLGEPDANIILIFSSLHNIQFFA